MADEVTDFSFSYEYGLDIWVPGAGGTDGEWVPFRFPTGLTFTVEQVTADAATYDDLGAPNNVVISESWTGSGNIQGHRTADGNYLPEVEALKALTEPDATGQKAIGKFRWYDKPAVGEPNPNDAYEGEATVKMERANTGNQEIGAHSFTLTGVGRRRQIENPWQGWTTP